MAQEPNEGLALGKHRGVMRRRVFVRGRGAVSSFSDAWPSTFQSLAEGHCAIRPVTRFDATGFPCTVAAAVDRHLNAPDRRLALARDAAREALEEASLLVDPRRLGVFVGAESGRAAFGTVLALARAAGGGPQFNAHSFAREALPLASRIEASAVSPATVASALAEEIHAEGPVQTLSMACVSGAAAIAEGARAIRMNQVDTVLCGGVGADVDPLMLAGFGHLGALSAVGVSRPFDTHRDGFVVGEGAAFLVLSAEPGPLEIELAGFGRSLDAYHLTAPDPEGDGMARAIETALKDSDVTCVDLIQAHGTSTPLNDALEARALRRVFGDALAHIPLSSVKGALGHWIAGAGALGALCAVESLHRGYMLPTAGLRHPDPELALDLVIGEARSGSFRTALVNAFAFGGANCSLVFRRLA